MEKKMQPILIGVIVVLAAAVIYLLAARGGARSSAYGGYKGNMAPAAANGGNPGTWSGNGQGNGQANGQASGAPSGAPAGGNMMTAQVPAELTADQLVQLKAGAADHAPTELTFNVTGGSFYYTPNEITVKQGDKVKIIFTNAGGMHNLTLDAFNVATKTIKTGESDTIEFTADKKGTFEFYCSVGNGYHRQKGQIGVILVQ